VSGGLEVPIVAIDDLIAMKRAERRDQDRVDPEEARASPQAEREAASEHEMRKRRHTALSK
jgi:hypothetical protein